MASRIKPLIEPW